MPASPVKPQTQMVGANVAAAYIADLLPPITNTTTHDVTDIASSDEDAAQPASPPNAYALWTTPDRPPAAPELRTLPQQPIMLSPGIVEILASLTPVAINRRAA